MARSSSEWTRTHCPNQHSQSALEVLAANNIDVMVSGGTPHTPTPVVSHAILNYNRGKKMA